MLQTKPVLRRILSILFTLIIVAFVAIALYWLGWQLPMMVWNDPNSLVSRITQIAFYIGFGLSAVMVLLNLITYSSFDREVRRNSLIRLFQNLVVCGILFYFITIIHQRG